MSIKIRRLLRAFVQNLIKYNIIHFRHFFIFIFFLSDILWIQTALLRKKNQEKLFLKSFVLYFLQFYFVYFLFKYTFTYTHTHTQYIYIYIYIVQFLYNQLYKMNAPDRFELFVIPEGRKKYDRYL